MESYKCSKNAYLVRTKSNGLTAGRPSLYSVLIPFYRLSSTSLSFMLFPGAVTTSYCQVKCGKLNTYCGKSIRKSLSQVLTGLPQLSFSFAPFHSKTGINPNSEMFFFGLRRWTMSTISATTMTILQYHQNYFHLNTPFHSPATHRTRTTVKAPRNNVLQPLSILNTSTTWLDHIYLQFIIWSLRIRAFENLQS